MSFYLQLPAPQLSSTQVQCHYCSQMFPRVTSTKASNYTDIFNSNKFTAKCCKARCGRYYCLGCIQNKFDGEFTSDRYRKDTWICYCCQDRCTCEMCLQAQKLINGKKDTKKRNKRPKTPKSSEILSQKTLQNNNTNNGDEEVGEQFQEAQICQGQGECSNQPRQQPQSKKKPKTCSSPPQPQSNLPHNVALSSNNDVPVMIEQSSVDLKIYGLSNSNINSHSHINSQQQLLSPQPTATEKVPPVAVVIGPSASSASSLPASSVTKTMKSASTSAKTKQINQKSSNNSKQQNVEGDSGTTSNQFTSIAANGLTSSTAITPPRQFLLSTTLPSATSLKQISLDNQNHTGNTGAYLCPTSSKKIPPYLERIMLVKETFKRLCVQYKAKKLRLLKEDRDRSRDKSNSQMLWGQTFEKESG